LAHLQFEAKVIYIIVEVAGLTLSKDVIAY